MARRTTGGLTVNQVAKAGPGFHSDGGGLYLHVGKNAKSWLLRYWRHGKVREMGLGSASVIGLRQARDLAIDAKRLVAAGGDPIEARKSEKQAAKIEAARSITFGEFAATFIAGKQAGWRNPKHADQWRMTLLGIGPNGQPSLHDYCKPIRNLPIGEVDSNAVLKVLGPIWSSKSETASRIRSRIENVLDAARVAGLRDGINPAQWKGVLKHMLPAKAKVRRVRHHPALPYADVPAFIRALRQCETSVAAACLEFLILSVVRPGNAVAARWDQINIEARTWTIPAEQMKGGEQHVMPLSDAALAVLNRMAKIRRGAFVFPSIMGRGAGAYRSSHHMSAAALSALIDRLNEGEARWLDPASGRPVVPHGFRSSFRIWTAETGAASEPVAEACLAHKVSDAVVAAYRRTTFDDERRRVMQAWANFACADRADNVIALHPSGA
jgi:integrase